MKSPEYHGTGRFLPHVFDLGYSHVGIFKDGQLEIIAIDQGNRITPSYIAFTPEGERLIGDAAKNQLISNPESKLSISLSFLSINHIYVFRYCF